MPNVAILIDGGYFLKRLPRVRRDIDVSDPDAVARSIRQLVRNHLDQLNDIYDVSNFYELLYRCFFYDASPYMNKEHTPISKRAIDYGKSNTAIFRNLLFDNLRRQRDFALRLGEVRKTGGVSWVLKSTTQRQLLSGDIQVSDLRDTNFVPNLRQKGVDMRIGLDIASLTLKKQADIIVLVSGDSDFVPAAKLARREGVKFILDPLWQNVSSDLLEHIDGLTSGFPNPSDTEP